LALSTLLNDVCSRFNEAPQYLAQCLIGDYKIGQLLAADKRIALVSATGSTRMGRAVAVTVAERFGRSLLELGGNNAMIVAESADISMTLRAITFAAVGTAGQRCTTLRRLFVHPKHYDDLLKHLKQAYASLPIGDPREAKTLIGPLIDKTAYEHMQQALHEARLQGGTVFGGGRVQMDHLSEGFYVNPAIVEMNAPSAVTEQETFAPILYVFKMTDIVQAIDANNAVAQGLSSSLMTLNLKEAERFLSASGSDCGIANINIGPSGAEIGGAFGGEKETGGGRESGSDAWKAYMRRQTQTVNYSDSLPLAQGVEFNF
jgi:aldehyde dehydrogenase (NAD+)